MSTDMKTFIAAIITAAATTVAFWAVVNRFQTKKLKRNQTANEQAWLQTVSDDLKAGKFASFDPDFVAKLETIINPLRDKGLLK